MTANSDFVLVLRGYAPAEVDAMVQHVQEALKSESLSLRATVRSELQQMSFRIRFRGYDRYQVDEYFRQVDTLLAAQ